MKYLALDLGTSFLKGAVLDLTHATIDHVARTPFPAPVDNLPPRHVEVDPAAVVRATQSLLDELTSYAPEVAGVMVTSQMHGIVLTDGAGKAFTNAVTWQDQRILDLLDPTASGAGTHFDRVVARLGQESIAATGNGLKPSLPLCTLVWWAAHGKLADGLVPASLPDYVLATLAGTRPVAERTMAASFGMLDLHRNEWHQGLLAEFGLDGLAWPRVVDVGAPAYHLSVDGRRLPCYAPVGDHQCALVGALLQAGELSLNISTGSQLSVLAADFVPGDYETRPYFDSGYLQTVTRIPAGRALNALVGLLTELAEAEGHTLHDPWATVAAVVEATPTTDMGMETSFFASPVGEWGSMSHLSEENLHVGHLFRAAFQSMARNYERCAARLAPPQPPTRLVFSGGVATRFATLREEIASRLALPYRLCPTSEDTLFGLLALARVAAGLAPNVAASVAELSQMVIEPR
jgi:sugar (pentulose or hexulose) kinase